MTPRGIVRVLIVVVVLATACDRGSSGDETDSTNPASESTDAPLVAPGCNTTGADTFSRHSPRAVSQIALLTTVDVAEEGCLDVITFEFQEPGVGTGLPPGYVVEYQPGPFTVGEGDEAQEYDIAGSSFLVVTLENASRSIESETSGQRVTYGGPTDFVPGGLNQLQEMLLVVDAPDQLQWVIGLDEERPFLVDAAAGPPRVTVKIA